MFSGNSWGSRGTAGGVGGRGVRPAGDAPSPVAVATAAAWCAPTGAGVDGLYGTGDDVRLAGTGVRDQANLIATIGSVVIKGQAIGTPGDEADNFGIVSEFIRKAKIGPVKLPLVGTPRTPDDRFFLAATGPGGDGSLSDVALLETVA